MNRTQRICIGFAALLLFGVEVQYGEAIAADDDATVRVFIFAGQSNMVGSDSKVQDIKRFPPFDGLADAQPDVRFSC